MPALPAAASNSIAVVLIQIVAQHPTHSGFKRGMFPPSNVELLVMESTTINVAKH
jgi:hypothetical protein